MSTTKPQGRAAVVAALLDAATRLYAERGPNAVSVRDIATEAGVNHGLVHRHFGSKDGLTAAVMTELATKVGDALGPPEPEETLAELLPRVFAATRTQGTYWRVLARALLDGHDPRRLQSSFPIVARITNALDRSTGGALPPATTRLITALVVGAGLGLLTFDPYLRAATDLPQRSVLSALLDAPEIVTSLTQSLAASAR